MIFQWPIFRRLVDCFVVQPFFIRFYRSCLTIFKKVDAEFVNRSWNSIVPVQHLLFLPRHFFLLKKKITFFSRVCVFTEFTSFFSLSFFFGRLALIQNDHWKRGTSLSRWHWNDFPMRRRGKKKKNKKPPPQKKTFFFVLPNEDHRNTATHDGGERRPLLFARRLSFFFCFGLLNGAAHLSRYAINRRLFPNFRHVGPNRLQ